MQRTLIVIALLAVALVTAAGLAYAQEDDAATPTAAPAETATVTTSVVTGTVTPAAAQLLPARQAVVKRPIDGGAVEVVFTDTGEIATVALANVDAPEVLTEMECFGREAAEYAAQGYGRSPLISVELAGPLEEGAGAGYVRLADGTFLNEVMVLFGYARYDDTVRSLYSAGIEAAQAQSKRGKTGLWRACGETEKPPKPCYLFNHDEVTSTTKRLALERFENASDVEGRFNHAYYDPVQNEIRVTWYLYGHEDEGSRWYAQEYYRLPGCEFDRVTFFED